jgi:hypothetical protein
MRSDVEAVSIASFALGKAFTAKDAKEKHFALPLLQ